MFGWPQTVQIYGRAIKITRHHTSFYSLYNTEKTEISEL